MAIPRRIAGWRRCYGIFEAPRNLFGGPAHSLGNRNLAGILWGASDDRRNSRMKPLPTAPSAASAAQRDVVELGWLQAIAGGDRAAFERLFHEYHRRLARFLSRVTRRDELIDEIINDTFWVVWQHAADFRRQSLVSTWIIGIAHRCALKALRDAGAAPAAEAAMAIEDLPDGEQRQHLQDQRNWILSGMERLPVEQRTTLVLAYYLGHSCEEIAQIMDCAVGTVKARLFHARVRLRNLLPALADNEHGDANEAG
jgi:RNA polymerase sigma-70 factor (ECF subfamily)